MNKKLLAVGILVVIAAVAIVAVTSNTFELAGEHSHDHDHKAMVYVGESTTEEVTVVFADDHIDFTGLGYSDLMLSQVPAASGERYEHVAEGLNVWTKGDEVTVYRNEETVFHGHHEEVH